MADLLSLSVTGITANEHRVYGGTVYANFVINLARPDGVPVSPRPQDWQLDLSRYPDMQAAIANVQTLITNAYLFESSMAPDPQQAYNPPPPDPAPTDPAV